MERYNKSKMQTVLEEPEVKELEEQEPDEADLIGIDEGEDDVEEDEVEPEDEEEPEDEIPPQW